MTEEEIEVLKLRGWELYPVDSTIENQVFKKGNHWAGFNCRGIDLVIMPIDPAIPPYNEMMRYAGPCPDLAAFEVICRIQKL